MESLTLTDAILSGNSATGGGAIYNGGSLTLTDATISGNSGSDGGGILNTGTAYLTNDTLSGNSATFGGGIGNHTTVTLINVTIAGNSASNGGGGIANGGTATLYNTIVADSTGGDIEFGSVGGDNNLIDDASSSGGLSNGVNGNIVGVDALLAGLANYGGSTQTIALLPGSPAIDMGSDSIPGINVPSTDQRGEGRVGPVDIGAFESQGFTLTPVTGSTPQSTATGTVFANPLAVIVTANNSIEPVVGGAVIFSAPSGGASASLNPTGPATIASNGQASVTATANGSAGSYTVTASASGAATPADFSLTNVAGAFNITGQVFNDLDGNSLKGPGEPGLAGWTLDLLNSSGAVIGTAITDNNGNYSFDGVAPGTLSVAEVAQPGWVQTEPLFPTVYTFTGKAGVNLNGLNFGDHSAASLSPAAVIDNGQGGYAETGSWSTVVAGFNGTNRVARTVHGSKPTATASWTFGALAAGSYNGLDHILGQEPVLHGRAFHRLRRHEQSGYDLRQRVDPGHTGSRRYEPGELRRCRLARAGKFFDRQRDA